MLHALTHQFTEHLDVVPAGVVLHITAIAPTACPEELDAVLRRASAAGVALLPPSTPDPTGLVLGYIGGPTIGPQVEPFGQLGT